MALEGTFDPFEALGLERDATFATIKHRYRQLARRYHPNRNQGTEESKWLLSEQFLNVHQAWLILSEVETRRRCLELLQLCDLQDEVVASVADLLYEDEHQEPRSAQRSPVVDGHISSDADDSDGDIPRIAGLKRRQTFEGPTKRSTGGPTGLDDIEEDSEASIHDGIPDGMNGSRTHQLRHRHTSSRNEDGSSDNANTAAERRRRFDKLRRKELDTFNDYRDAMMDKFEAEAASQRAKEQFETARWRRQYYERAPKGSAQRVRFVKAITNVVKSLKTQQPSRLRDGRRGSIATVPITPIEPTAQLGLPSRGKSVRQKGPISDITGDQTSSDEEDDKHYHTSPVRSPRAISPRPGRPRHRRFDSLPNPVPTGPNTHHLPNGNHDPISPISGPGPRLFVRAPTNLSEMSAFNIHAPDEESGSASSNSSHAPPIKKNDSFVLLPSTGTSDLFEITDDRRSRSRSVDLRSPSRARSPTQHVTADVCHFSIKDVGQLRHRSIPVDHVHMLSYQEKQWMLGTEPDKDMDPGTLLLHLSRIDRLVASGFVVKPDIKEKFNFRLIYSHREVVKEQHHTFIALSYRRKLHVQQKHNHFTLPLEPEIFQAVWDERLSDNEGVWIDQICIGDTKEEQTISMSAMDMVYRSARLVVVALDDIELEPHEETVLESHMAEYDRQHHIPANKRFRRRQTPYLDSHRDLFRVIRKLMTSSWFQRAWCRHEMRLGREHIFLVPCRRPRSLFDKSVLRFTGKCLTHLLGLATEVPFESSIESAKGALYNFFRDRSKLQGVQTVRSHHGNFTTVVAEVFAMQAGGDPKIPEAQREADARKDKISIILNTMECGLALAPKMRDINITLPEHECHYRLLLLALAARDPGALGSVGQPLRKMPFGLSSSWLSEPTNVDAGLNNYRTLNRLPVNSMICAGRSNGEHFVQLPLKIFQADIALMPAQSPTILELARRFMTHCDEKELGRHRKSYFINNRALDHIFGSMRDVYIETLVCVFECGPDWMSDVCERYGVGRWKHDLEPALSLLIAFKNTNGRWPEKAWNEKGAGFIMDFANFLIVRGMPHRQITEPETWRPVWVAAPSGGKVVTFAPVEEVKVAIPAALFDPDYVKLARLWVLKRRGLKCQGEWTLLGKSVIFADDLSIEGLQIDDGTIRGNQKVFGRLPAVQVGVEGRLRVLG